MKRKLEIGKSYPYDDTAYTLIAENKTVYVFINCCQRILVIEKNDFWENTDVDEFDDDYFKCTGFYKDKEGKLFYVIAGGDIITSVSVDEDNKVYPNKSYRFIYNLKFDELRRVDIQKDKRFSRLLLYVPKYNIGDIFIAKGLHDNYVAKIQVSKYGNADKHFYYMYNGLNVVMETNIISILPSDKVNKFLFLTKNINELINLSSDSIPEGPFKDSIIESVNYIKKITGEQK